MSPEAIAAIGLGIRASVSLVRAAKEARERLQQTRQWTAEQEAAYAEHIATTTREQHWLTDEELARRAGS